MGDIIRYGREFKAVEKILSVNVFDFSDTLVG